MKLYVLACKKLSKKQQFVQGTHAAIEWAKNNRSNHDHPALVMLQVDDIEQWKQKMIPYEHYGFRDSYYNNRLTAIASTEIEHLVSDLKLI
jgi:hypothetical protein